ncbi:ribonuclease Z [Candidatus Woesearchaeota archaeon]|nr:ribonuclease Z [Candidatus Woesearchaeota archaeon]MCF7901408.1 ribonuclease Z [Candidatus Woesearchaeota archaeon]MCF8012979.1 ribonuclease Z [Candidatus Woesearchaeota archaeon]
MTYEITFLGTAGMVPTKDRNVQGIYLDYNGEGILIDCGEGTQRQMNIKGINRLKVKKILISHWHGDHVSGLIGLIQTLGNANKEDHHKLTIFGPKGTKKHMNHLLNSCIFDLSVDLTITELDLNDLKTIFEHEDYMIEAAALEHSTPCLGYSFIEKDKRNINLPKAKKLGLSEGPNLGKLQRGQTIKHEGKTITPDMVSTIKKGKKTTFILDTGLTENCYKLAENSDLLICESTMSIKLAEKAELRKHMTAQGAAQIASKSNTKKLILTHFSQRYRTLHDLEEEAKAVFPNTELAFDFMKVKL